MYYNSTKQDAEDKIDTTQVAMDDAQVVLDKVQSKVDSLETKLSRTPSGTLILTQIQI